MGVKRHPAFRITNGRTNSSKGNFDPGARALTKQEEVVFMREGSKLFTGLKATVDATY